MRIVDPLPELQRLQRLATPGSWLRALAAASADEIDALRRLCGGHVRRRERAAVWIVTVLGLLCVALWVGGALGLIDVHVYIGPAGDGNGH